MQLGNYINGGSTATAYVDLDNDNSIILKVYKETDIVRDAIAAKIQATGIIPKHVPNITFLKKDNSVKYFRIPRYYRDYSDLSSKLEDCEFDYVSETGGRHTFDLEDFIKLVGKLVDPDIIFAMRWIYGAIQDYMAEHGINQIYSIDFNSGNILFDNEGDAILIDIFHAYG